MKVLIRSIVFVLVAQATTASAVPTLTVTDARRGSWVFSGIGSPVLYDDLIGCVSPPWELSWESDPATGVEYRYGWDIIDLNDPVLWDVDWGSYSSAPPHAFYFGTHVFTVEARDAVGDVTRGEIRIQVIQSSAPELTLDEATRGSWVFVTVDNPLVVLSENPTNPPTPWEFSWSAISCTATQVPLMYRYGWDVSDPNNDADPGWSPWGPDTSAPPQIFYFGTHTFTVEVIDGDGNKTRGVVALGISGPTPVRKTTWGAVKSKYLE